MIAGYSWQIKDVTPPQGTAKIYSFYEHYCKIWGSRSGRANQLAAHYKRRRAKLI